MARSQVNSDKIAAAGASKRSPQARFDDYLQSRGMRGTQQRRYLLGVVFALKGHFDADQLIAQLPKRGEKQYVSRPTVYRTLGEFVDAGLLRKFELSGRSVYQHDFGYPPNDHLFCRQCRRLIEFRDEALPELVSQVARRLNFQQASHRLIVEGTCADCRMSQRRPRKRVDLI